MTDRPTAVVAGSLGILGGSFDPIHLAHLALAQEAAESLGLERILFVPAGSPPHKPAGAIAPAADRLAMVELAIADNDRFAASRIELDRPGPSYTVDTLEALAASGGTDEADEATGAMTLILSAEAFVDFMSWRSPRRVLQLARVAVAPRDGYPDVGQDFVATNLAKLVERVVFLEGPRIRLSASMLRKRASAGRSLRYLVPNAVAAYIGDHGLYGSPMRNNQT